MLRALMDAVDSMWEYTGSLIRAMEILRKNKRETLEVKNVTKFKNATDGL